MALVAVERVTPLPGQSIWVAEGEDEADGSHVIFAGDYRMMADLEVAVAILGPITASIEEWQVIMRHPRECPAALVTFAPYSDEFVRARLGMD